MQPSITQTLIDLNRQFYQTFAPQFSATRQRLQPGVQHLLPELLKAHRILDLGCGNGELWRTLHRQGFGGEYVGLDFSPGLLSDAASGSNSARFLQADLTEPGWERGLAPQSFDLILAFAVLHHLPSQALRQRLAAQVLSLLTPSGHWIHSNWQFLNSPRLRERIQPWERVGLSDSDLEPGDTLLDWRQGGEGLRYVHHFQPDELAELAQQAGFRPLESFFSDGQGGNLSLYQIWEPAE